MLQRMVVTAILAAACGAAEAGPSLIDTPENPSNGAAAAITGTVTDAQLRPVGGGTVEILAGTTLVQTAPVSAGGSYAIATIPAGTYAVRLQPPLNYSIGPSEPSQKPVTVAEKPTSAATVSFTVQPAVAYDDLQTYTSTQQILAFCGQAGRPEQPTDFWAGQGRDGNCNGSISQITYDNAEKAIRYDWPARPTCPNGPSACSMTVSLYPRVNPLRVTGSELWIRFTDKLSSNFKAGGGGAINSSIEYKYLFLDLFAPSQAVGNHNGVGQFQVELENGVAGTAQTNFALRMKILDYKNRHTSTSEPGQPSDYLLGPNYAGTYHTWVFGITNIGSPAVTFTAYLDGVLVRQITGAWFPGVALDAVTVLGIQMGANINNGPDQPQSRWWRELGVYRTRPSLKPLVVQ